MNGKGAYRLDGGEGTSSDSPCENGVERSDDSKHYHCDYDTSQTSLRQSPNTNKKTVKMEEIIQQIYVFLSQR